MAPLLVVLVVLVMTRGSRSTATTYRTPSVSIASAKTVSVTIPDMTPIVMGSMLAVKTHIDLRQQPGAELHVIIQVEGPSSLKLLSESCDGSCVRQFLHAAHSPELLMRVLGCRETRSPTGAARVILSCRVLVSIVVVVGGHYRIMKTYELQSSRMKC